MPETQCYLVQACACSFALQTPESRNIISMLVIVIKSINHQSIKQMKTLSNKNTMLNDWYNQLCSPDQKADNSKD